MAVGTQVLVQTGFQKFHLKSRLIIHQQTVHLSEQMADIVDTADMTDTADMADTAGTVDMDL